MKSSFKSDYKTEQEIGKFLDKYFYNQELVGDFYRYQEEGEQKKGKDVKFSLGDLKDIIVDEKAQIRYTNRNLPSFIMEMQWLSEDGSKNEGWFINPKYETQYYLLIWPNATKDKGYKAEDITWLECILLEKKEMLNHFIKKDIDFSRISEICDYIYKKGNYGKQQDYDYDDCYFFFSNDIEPEMPINIVVKKPVLVNLSHFHFCMVREGDKVYIKWKKLTLDGDSFYVN